MKIALLTTLWRRHALAACVLANGKRIRDEIGAGGDTGVLVAVGSEGDVSRKLAESNGWDYVEFPNQPLGAKLNAGFKRCQELGVDAVIAHGSDDFAPSMLIQEWMDRIEFHGATICGLLDMFKVRGKDWLALHWTGYRGARKGESIGPWRAVSKEILDAIDWAPYDADLSCNLDNSMTKRLDEKCPGWKDSAHVVAMAAIDNGSGSDVSVFDVSMPDRITPWELSAWGAAPAQWPDLAPWLSPEQRSAIEAAVTADEPNAVFAPCEKPRLSAAIIVKDMLDTFPATLRSLVGYVDEVCVLVDASSDPRTEEMARAAGCVVQVQPWKGYGPQRTDSLRMCRAPWALVIDADEVLVSGMDVRDELANAPEGFDGLAVTMQIGAYGSGQIQTSRAIRIVRTDRAFYEFEEHNELRGVQSAGACSLVFRTSYADRSEQSLAMKLDRLMEMHEKRPTEQHHIYHVAKILRALGNYQGCAQWAAKCIELGEETLYGGAAYYELAIATGASGDLATQDAILLRATKLHPDHADMWALWTATSLLRACKAATEPGRYSMLAQTFGLQEALRAPQAGQMLRLPLVIEMQRRPATLPACPAPTP